MVRASMYEGTASQERGPARFSGGNALERWPDGLDQHGEAGTGAQRPSAQPPGGPTSRTTARACIPTSASLAIGPNGEEGTSMEVPLPLLKTPLPAR